MMFLFSYGKNVEAMLIGLVDGMAWIDWLDAALDAAIETETT